MEIILLKEVENLGLPEDVVNVKPGFARNYLIPQRMAVVANASNMKQLAERQKQLNRREGKLLEQIEEIKAKLKATIIKVGAKVGTTDKIFGSVTTHHLSEAIKDQTNIDIDRRKIKILGDDIKTLGSYQAEVDLHKEHRFEVNFEVIPE